MPSIETSAPSALDLTYIRANSPHSRKLSTGTPPYSSTGPAERKSRSA